MHGYGSYRGEPQRQAARAAVLNDGGALAVALPTGRGKTAVAWSKALLSDHGVSIVVVPTVVLALDMERRTQEASQARQRDGRGSLSPYDRFAYVGSLDAGLKRELREAVRAGTQRLLYTSPEAFVSKSRTRYCGLCQGRTPATDRDRRSAPCRSAGADFRLRVPDHAGPDSRGMAGRPTCEKAIGPTAPARRSLSGPSMCSHNCSRSEVARSTCFGDRSCGPSPRTF